MHRRHRWKLEDDRRGASVSKGTLKGALSLAFVPRRIRTSVRIIFDES